MSGLTFKAILLSLCLALLGNNARASSQDVKAKFLESKIVPDLIGTAPEKGLEVTYPGDVKVELGNTLTEQQTQVQPSVSYEVDANSMYTLIMADPDTPKGTFLHWLVVNVPGTDLGKGETKSSYYGPKPPAGTGKHRYVFLAYRQASPVVGVKDLSSLSKRIVVLKDLTKQLKLGNPVSGNFFTVQAA